MPSRAVTPPMSRHLGWLLVLAACGGTDAAPVDRADEAVSVEVAEVSDRLETNVVIAIGRYAPRDEIPLAFKTGGIVARVDVEEGVRVRQGQRLAALDLREIDAMVARAQAGADKAQRDRDRVARLAADSVATRAQFQDAETGLAAARADLAQALVNREYSVITAPEDGVIQQRFVVAGTLVSPGMPVLLLGGGRRGAVMRVALADRDVVRVRAGDAARATFSALPDRTFDGRVTLVGQAADPRTGTYPAEIALRDASALPLGLLGEVRITAGSTRGARRRGGAIPMTALLETDADSATVLTLTSRRDTLPVARRVRIVSLVEDHALVEGLAIGTLVIARGAAFVTPGAMVRVREIGATETGARP